ncbi:MAG: 30S ribosomal protein S9 [Deltaproteobacteria bacterium]|nr:30S ribosomal protein S9 [Deltaproteobacteria bacterium]MBW1922051.1 30S ribosomal protein S9 [Deltaproteobacteria bacterium]MBW1949806.1 30S ribosomal protein S9 [Deltaproteobacteria bacterium]MBW2007685.1 30S ribosomal protein S9 [Deltaproteobacteria bacterium]MBW2103544.1 30S ribosomal protein S9 [Deltaproteobacteria bacterium]
MAEELYHAVGKRKTSIARVWLKPGTGTLTINKRPEAEFLARESDRIMVRAPLKLAELEGRFDVNVNVRGGGISGQSGAIRHGISKALVLLDPELREPLKKAGFLTRDDRMKERKKYGQPGARKRFQYSKR